MDPMIFPATMEEFSTESATSREMPSTCDEAFGLEKIGKSIDKASITQPFSTSRKSGPVIMEPFKDEVGCNPRLEDNIGIFLSIYPEECRVRVK